MKRKGYFSNYSETSIIPKPDKNVTREENYRLVSAMNRDKYAYENFNKSNLTVSINQHIKRVLYHDTSGVYQEYKVCLIFEKSSMQFTI